MIVSPMNQVFYPQEADRLFGQCDCSGDADCDWCSVYYTGEDPIFTVPEEMAWVEYAKSIRAGVC